MNNNTNKRKQSDTSKKLVEQLKEWTTSGQKSLQNTIKQSNPYLPKEDKQTKWDKKKSSDPNLQKAKRIGKRSIPHSKNRNTSDDRISADFMVQSDIENKLDSKIVLLAKERDSGEINFTDERSEDMFGGDRRESYE